MGSVVQRALISVTDKSGVVELARGLVALGVEIVSTGGTARVLTEGGVTVVPLETFTGWPEMLDGRVKTLHPKVHAGILARRDSEAHQREMDAHGLLAIDLVVVNLYDFDGAIGRADAAPAEVIEAIDIGGPTLLRAAAKNHEGVLAVVRPSDYARVLEALRAGSVDGALRRELAALVFAHTARYDAAVAGYFERLAQPETGAPSIVTRSAEKVQELRYGENAHQTAAFYRNPGPPSGLARAEVLQGKALSYNNLLDLDAALGITVDVAALRPETVNAVFIKHNNPCGVALHEDTAEAIRRARACDPISAFGAVVAVSSPIDRAAAEALTEAFVEAVIAPDFTDQARRILAGKKNLRALRLDEDWRPPASTPVWREVRGGILRQDQDTRADPQAEVEAARVVTRAPPSEAQRQALAFAWVIAKHVRSNAIVFARADRLVGVGAGQMSRVDAVRLCELKAGEALRGTVVASDAFFPFRDGVDVLAGAGAEAIIQPGGSIRDEEVVTAADEHGLPMLFTGVRHFRH